MLGRPRPEFDYSAAFDQITSLVLDFREAGGSAVVDAGMTWFGPNPWLYVGLSRSTGIHIIASVGFFHEMDCPLPPMVYALSIDELADWIVDGLTNGLWGSGIKAGVIKVGSSSDRITAAEEKTFRAAARAHLRTGAGIMTHVSFPSLQAGVGLRQVEIFEEEGVDLRKVVIGHMGWDTIANPLEYHVAIADRGASLGYDQIGNHAYHDDGYWVDLVKELVERNLDQRVLLAHDSVGAWPERLEKYEDDEINKTYSYILREILPQLRRAGVSDSALHTILTENPKRLLSLPS